MLRKEIQENEHNDYFKRYIDLVKSEENLLEILLQTQSETISFFRSLPQNKHNHAYDQGKWTIKEVLQHLIDTERVFSYRCFRIARHDETPLAGFDQDIYISPSYANSKSMDMLLEEFSLVRAYFINMVHSFKENDLCHIGYASGSPVSARALIAMNSGHYRWHINIIKDRYL